MKNLKAIGFWVVILTIWGCNNSVKKNTDYIVINGKTMGSTYEIAYKGKVELKEKIEFMMGYYSYLISTYDSQSIISKFNNNQILNSEDSISYLKSIDIFTKIDSLSLKIYNISNETFNPGISDLINYWGFGERKKNPNLVDSTLIKQLKNQVYGFKVEFMGTKPLKKNTMQKLNFNGIAAGQLVDIVAKMLENEHQINDYYINITGELKVKGENENNEFWKIKIEKPLLKAEKPVAFCEIDLNNLAMATSGNYRQYFYYNGKRLGHSIDPRTGFPSMNEMLSASIICKSAAEADALATSCMILGLEKSIELIKNNPEYSAIFIYEKDQKLNYWKSNNLEIKILD